MKILENAQRGIIPAAQYIRMSTEHQRYSPDNQRAVIAAYAALRGFRIVQTYQDSGKSGLTLSGRPALKQLLSDVLGDDTAFKAVLVLDVSRWGRFQDTDQSAYYEYMCREAGVAIHFCVEAFENDGSAIASIVKHMKRLMAAEYSRELSARVSRAVRQQARLGFKQGGSAGLGLRRQVVDLEGMPRMVLDAGQRKALSTDKVVYMRGPDAEVALVQRIYRMFVRDLKRLGQIAEILNGEGIKHPRGGPWQSATIRHILSHDIYRGQYVFGRRYNNLGRPYFAPIEERVDVSVLRPIISADLFNAAAMRLSKTGRWCSTDEELDNGLRRLFAEKGYLTSAMIDACDYLPSAKCYTRRYGSLVAAFKSVGYEKPTVLKCKADGIPYTDEDLLAEIRRIHAECGSISGKALDDDPAAPDRKYFMRRFGGLMNAFALAGVGNAPETPRLAAALSRQRHQHAQESLPRKTPRHRTANGTIITDDELLDGLKSLLAVHGFLTRRLIDLDPSLPTASYYRRRFKELKIAYALVGFASSQKEIVLAANQRLKTHAERM